MKNATLTILKTRSASLVQLVELTGQPREVILDDFTAIRDFYQAQVIRSFRAASGAKMFELTI